MKKIKSLLKKTFLFILSLLIFFSGITFAVSAEESTSNEAISVITDILNAEISESSCKNIQDWINIELTQNAGISSEWYILALSQYQKYDFTSYKNALEKYLSENKVPSASTNEKYALALIASNGNKEKIKTILSSSVGKQGIMSWIFGLHIMNNGYLSDEYDIGFVKEKILSLQQDSGAWSLSGTKGDVDTTAMAVQSLAPYYDEADVKISIEKALQYLSESQLENGEFQQFGVNNCESIAQVIIALSCLGIDCQYDSRFIKNGITLFDALYHFLLPDGRYTHTLESEYNRMATVQTLCAMVSYLRLSEDNPNFYIYRNNVEENNAFVSEPYYEQNLYDSETEQNDFKNKDIGYKPIAIIIIIAITLLCCLILFFAKKRDKEIFIIILIVASVVIAFVLLTDFRSVEDYNSVESKSNPIGSVTISIKCNTLKDYASDEKIPDDLIILNKTSVEIEEGDTVYDVLMSVASKNKIHIETNGIAQNVYVEGIANIYEFEFGDLSGWTYYINGVSASVSCGNYALKPDDIIEWHYTLNLGEDIK